MANTLHFYSPQTAQMLLMAQQVRAWERLGPADYAALQQRQLHGLMRHAHQYSPFWCERLEAAGFTAGLAAAPGTVLRRLPILTRADLQTHFSAARARWPALQESDVATSTTSGSTGEPVRVEKVSAMYAPLYAAISWIEAQWHGRNPTRKIAVLTTGIADGTRDTWGDMYSAMGLRGMSVMRNLTLHSTESHLEWLQEHRPDYLKCSPLAAAELARFALARGLHIPLQQIISQSERITPGQRALCHRAFGAKIVDRYSCEETGWIGLQCPEHDHLHLLGATTLMEIGDDQGQPCPIGVRGRVLVTSLHSLAMPIIRYELGDLAEWGHACSCGMTLPVIARLWGRTRHQLQLPDGPLPMPFLGDELGLIETIRAFRIRQYTDGTLELEIEAADPFTPAEHRAVRAIFDTNGLGSLPLHISQTPRIDWPPGRKREEFERVAHAWTEKPPGGTALPHA